MSAGILAGLAFGVAGMFAIAQEGVGYDLLGILLWAIPTIFQERLMRDLLRLARWGWDKREQKG